MSDENKEIVVRSPLELLSTVGYNILGPSSKTLGEFLNLGTEAATKNVQKVLQFGEAFLKNPRGHANLRVAMRILAEARFVDDVAVQLYLAGVLAASAGEEDGTDDSAISMADLVCRLSASQARAHFVLYESIRRNWKSYKVLSHEEDRDHCEVLFGQDDLKKVIGLENKNNSDVRLQSTLVGMKKELLVGSRLILYGPGAMLEKQGIVCEKYSGLVSPSIEGIRLFLWANGLAHQKIEDFLMIPDEHFLILKYTASMFEDFISSVSRPKRAKSA